MRDNSLTFRFWFYWARLVQWWNTDVWGWIIDVPISSPMGEIGHCIGRRTGKPVYCQDCDDGREEK